MLTNHAQAQAAIGTTVHGIEDSTFVARTVEALQYYLSSEQ